METLPHNKHTLAYFVEVVHEDKWGPKYKSGEITRPLIVNVEKNIYMDTKIQLLFLPLLIENNG